MDELKDIRKKIDGIDAQLAGLFEQRMECAREIAAYKAAHGLSVLDPAREEETVRQGSMRVLDRDIREGTAGPFAVAVCDVNDLKKTNDTFGHKAGDQLLKDACAIICNTFKHSPVFRIGGDEFAAILRGRDYEDRSGLLARFQERNKRALERGGIVVACGIADFRPEEDEAMAAVFERADAEMYKNKTEMTIGRQ